MTREKQIEEFANSQIDCEFFDDSLYKGIIIGANWADENPQMRKDYEFLFMLKKQELIKKACGWLKAHIKLETASYADLWDPSDIDLLVTDFTTVDEMIENFKKTIEE